MKTPHSRKFDVEQLWLKRYALIEREVVQKIDEEFDEDEAGAIVKDPLKSEAPAIIQEEIEAFSQWASAQPHPMVAIFYNEKGEKLL